MHRTLEHPTKIDTLSQANVSIHVAVQRDQQSQRDWLAYENFMDSLDANPHPFLFPDKPSDADVLIDFCKIAAIVFIAWMFWRTFFP